MRFDPVLKARDFPNWIDENTPLETLKTMILENSGNAIQRFIMERWLRNKDINKDAYQNGLGEAMKKLIDDFGFRYPGIKRVEYVYFYSVSAVEDPIRKGYLQEAYRLGQDFCRL